MNLSKKIVGVMSIPRLTFSDNTTCVISAIRNLGIDIGQFGGVFWGQAMTLGLQWALDLGVEFVLTIDYDSVFSEQDVYKLYETAQLEDSDCIFPVQMGRSMNYLFGTKNETITPEEINNNVYNANSGHFGLTLIRCSALKKMEKPWFVPVQDKEGTWDISKGKMDEDINFFHKWKECGNNVHLAPQIVIGHLELLVLYPDKNLLPAVTTIKSWKMDGKPQDCWGIIPGSEYLTDAEGNPIGMNDAKLIVDLEGNPIDIDKLMEKSK